MGSEVEGVQWGVGRGEGQEREGHRWRGVVRCDAVRCELLAGEGKWWDAEMMLLNVRGGKGILCDYSLCLGL